MLLALQASTVIGGLLHWNDASDPGMMNYFMLLVILILIPAVWIMPRRTNRRIVDRSVSGNELRVRVYENLCEVFIPAEDKSMNLSMPLKNMRFLNVRRCFYFPLPTAACSRCLSGAFPGAPRRLPVSVWSGDRVK